MVKNKKSLSKSRLMRGVQCPKSLWLSLYQPELEPKADAATQFQFDEGNEVGERARRWIGADGVLIETPFYDLAGAAKETQRAIDSGNNLIFEAAFLKDGLFARADILKKDKKKWHLIEVKKSTQVKGYHFDDSAIQTAIIESAGMKLESISLMHLNREAVFPDLDELFIIEDLTDEIRKLQKKTKSTIKSLKMVAESKMEPTATIGPHCSDPFDCPFMDHCWKDVPKGSVFELPGMRTDKQWELFDGGQRTIHSLNPDEFKGKTKRAIEVVKNKKMFIDKKVIKESISRWQWPLYFFDFETVAPAIPRYAGASPYGAAPFQFSCHIWTNIKTDRLDHREYLHTEATDPRDGVIKAMLDSLGDSGSIVAYNKGFEIGVITKLAEFDKKNKKALLSLVDRFVDPLPIFREAVYHSDFKGSFSIKAVAPALLGDSLSYDDLEVGDGSTAQALADGILRGTITGKDKDKLIPNLLEYCRQDTLAMVELVKWLIREVGDR